jgi:predicted RNA-binding Zn-ribbon protein involved in translation (DUF1610 family)
MTIRLEQECPQCAAPVALHDTDRLLRCPFCGVASVLSTSDFFRLALPLKSVSDSVVHVPYLHCKGSIFVCNSRSIAHRIVDTSRLALELTGLPLSLGMRPQAMKLRYASPDMAGLFLHHSLSLTTMLEDINHRTLTADSDPEYHRAFIGDVINIIYLPLVIDNDRLLDGVLDRPLARLPDGFDKALSAHHGPLQWRMSFLASICPQCGWNLAGERDSVALTCANCHTVWEADGNTLREVAFSVVAAGGDSSVYLPFWRIRAKSEGAGIDSYGDFMRRTNQPRIPRSEWQEQPMYYWCPAFKIRPSVFLNLASRLTITQLAGGEERLPRATLHPVTLPKKEAVLGLKLILADSALNKEDILPLLPDIRFEILETSLVYLPFAVTSHELVLRSILLSINRKALEYGRSL